MTEEDIYTKYGRLTERHDNLTKQCAILIRLLIDIKEGKIKPEDIDLKGSK